MEGCQHGKINLSFTLGVSYDVFWWLENRDKIAYDEMVNYAALNNGYLQRIKEEDSQLQKGVQMSLF